MEICQCYCPNKECEDYEKKGQVNISFVERSNLTLRQHWRGLGRKSNRFSKGISKLEPQLYFALGYYHFVKEHFGLRREP